MRTFKGIKGSNIIDSTYNANPAGMQEALKLLCQSWSQKHKIAVIGDMRELGLSEVSTQTTCRLGR